MCRQERASVAAIAISLLLNAYVLIRLNQMFAAGVLDGPDAPMVWARMVVWIVPAAIVLTVVVHLLGIALSREDDAGGPAADERDRLFQVRGMSVTLVVFGLGFVGSLIGLALGWTPLTGFLAIYYSAAAGDLLGNVVRLASYRVGS